ncbi:MAG: hypothetical protein D8M28_02055 [Proteobacteria bacterium]|nr:hypothetical protein [Pseudomonadota bacterium]
MTEGKAENLEASKIEDSLKHVSSEKRILEAETRFGGSTAPSGATDITSTKGKKDNKATSKFQQPKMGDALGIGLFVDQVMGLLQDFQPQKQDMLGGKKKNDGKKNDGQKPKQGKDLMTSTSLNQSKFAAGTARAKLDNLLTVEAKLMEARDNKYLFSPEQLSRLEQGISHLPADLHREHGAGMNRLEQALDGIKLNNGQKPGVRHPGQKRKKGVQASM